MKGVGRTQAGNCQAKSELLQVIEIADHRTPKEIKNKLDMLLGNNADEKEPVLN